MFDSRSSTGRFAGDGEDKKDRKDDKPGPGAYHHKELLGDSGAMTNFTRSIQRNVSSARAETPDPGQYAPVEPSVTSKMPKQGGYQFSNSDTGRIPAANENGAKVIYDPNGENGTFDNELNLTNGNTRSPRGSHGNKNPGPGTYNVVAAAPALAASSPQWGFGTNEARPHQTIISRNAIQAPVPGPGTYVQSTCVGAGPKFTMRGRKQDGYLSTPGPGSYGGHYTQFI